MNLPLITLLLFSQNYQISLISGNHFLEFIDLFNQYLIEHNKDAFKTTQIEFKKEVQGFDNNTYYYIDFADNNGFVLYQPHGNKVVLFDTNADIVSLREIDNVYYDSFCFFDGDGNLIWNKNLNNHPLISNSNRDNAFTPGSIASLYTSPIEYGDIQTLLSTKYSSILGLSVYSQGKLSGLASTMNSEGYEQFDESVYQMYNNGFYYSEGNCGIVSIANALSYYSNYGSCSSMPGYYLFSHITPSIHEPDYASYVANYGYYPIYYTVSIHKICNDVRLNAIDAGYYCCGMGDTETEYAFEKTALDYGYIGTFTTSYNNSSLFSLSSIKNEIDNNRPMQLRTQDDVCYGGHGMMITGYSYYRAFDWVQPQHNSPYGFFVEYILPFVSIYDGHTYNERWYDLSSLSNLGSEYNRASAQTVATLHIEDDD